MNNDLEIRLKEAVARFKAMAPDEQEKMLKEQRERTAKAEASWPKAKYKFVNGVKVYDSYEDYLND